jgi:hypothetical protein
VPGAFEGGIDRGDDERPVRFDDRALHGDDQVGSRFGVFCFDKEQIGDGAGLGLDHCWLRPDISVARTHPRSSTQ